jgi:hypothetical protein
MSVGNETVIGMTAILGYARVSTTGQDLDADGWWRSYAARLGRRAGRRHRVVQPGWVTRTVRNRHAS